VSRERARRRAEREAAAALRAARQARRDRWRQLTGLERLRRPRSTNRNRNRNRNRAERRPASSALGRQRARQNALLLAVLVPANAVYWLLQPSWPWRIGALVATVIAWPLLVVLLFDRRPSR